MSHTILLPYQPPFDWLAALVFISNRAIEGIDEVRDGFYFRVIPGGSFSVSHDPEGGALVARFTGDPPEDAERRLRQVFDLDADLSAISRRLRQDPFMEALVAKRPAVRVPGWWDGFETAIRAVLGQQVSIVAARLLAKRLVERCGCGPCFPSAGQILEADLAGMGMPGSRAQTLKAVAAAALDDPSLFKRGHSVDETVARLRSIKGIGDWSAHYIAIRACREPDAFPSSDVGLLRGMADSAGVRPIPAELLARAEAWRPWRAYAAHHIWAEDAERLGLGDGLPQREV